MPIIFGWGRQTIKKIGFTFKNLCGHCHNEEYWVLARITTWFTIFFIPVIPYSIKHFLSCPVCQYGLVLDQKQLEQIKPIAEMNQLFADGKITEQEYQAQLNQLSSGGGGVLENSKQLEPVKEPAMVEKAEILYCGHCNNKLDGNDKFCSKCGAQI